MIARINGTRAGFRLGAASILAALPRASMPPCNLVTRHPNDTERCRPSTWLRHQIADLL